ncbi:MAG TPA: RusA family crossover junction endodeoxyribonuclease [Naasia sp.]
MIEFEVAGVPVPQGSKTAFVVGRRAVITDQNAKVLKPWRTAVAEAAQYAAFGRTEELLPLRKAQAALDVDLVFLLPRPASVKRSWPSVSPDIDKLARSVLDGLTASGLIRDDSQIVRLVALKRYSDRPGAVVKVGLMAEEEN